MSETPTGSLETKYGAIRFWLWSPSVVVIEGERLVVNNIPYKFNGEFTLDDGKWKPNSDHLCRLDVFGGVIWNKSPTPLASKSVLQELALVWTNSVELEWLKQAQVNCAKTAVAQVENQIQSLEKELKTAQTALANAERELRIVTKELVS